MNKNVLALIKVEEYICHITFNSHLSGLNRKIDTQPILEQAQK